MDRLLFEEGASETVSPGQAAESGAGRARLRVPHRNQVEMHWASLDELLEADHRARLVWSAVAKLRLNDWLEEIQAAKRWWTAALLRAGRWKRRPQPAARCTLR